jgi:glycosyltransferase involved in cell wall biosynthesis
MVEEKPKPRRVLHLIPTLGYGGAERQLAYLAHGLRDVGWEVHVGLLGAGQNLERLRESNATGHFLEYSSHYDPALLARVRRLIRRVEPAVVQTWIPMMDILGGLSALSCNVPWILSERSAPAEIPASAKLRVRAFLARRAFAVVSNSLGGDAYWAARLGPTVVHRVIPNALPLSEIEAAAAADPESLGFPRDARIAIYVGRLEPLKNIPLLLETLAGFVQEGGFALLCGVGALAPEVERWIRSEGLGDRIVAPGYLPNVFSWLKRADVFISLSQYEGMPNAVMEAMAAGCPLVLSDIPAHRAVLDEDSAVFVDPGDPRTTREALLSVVRRPDVAAARVRAARERAAHWSVAALAGQYASLYERASAHSIHRDALPAPLVIDRGEDA